MPKPNRFTCTPLAEHPGWQTLKPPESDYLVQFDLNLNHEHALHGLFYHLGAADGLGDELSQISSLKHNIKTNELNLPWAISSDTGKVQSSKLQQYLVKLRQSSHGRHLLALEGNAGRESAMYEEYNHYREIVWPTLGERY